MTNESDEAIIAESDEAAEQSADDTVSFNLFVPGTKARSTKGVIEGILENKLVPLKVRQDPLRVTIEPTDEYVTVQSTLLFF